MQSSYSIQKVINYLSKEPPFLRIEYRDSEILRLKYQGNGIDLKYEIYGSQDQEITYDGKKLLKDLIEYKAGKGIPLNTIDVGAYLYFNFPDKISKINYAGNTIKPRTMDSFNIRINASYPPKEHFSTLLSTVNKNYLFDTSADLHQEYIVGKKFAIKEFCGNPTNQIVCLNFLEKQALQSKSSCAYWTLAFIDTIIEKDNIKEVITNDCLKPEIFQEVFAKVINYNLNFAEQKNCKLFLNNCFEKIQQENLKLK